jgi:TRAP transporter TAXI family solute receptor
MSKVINEKSGYIKLNATTPSSISLVPQMIHEGQAIIGIGMADMMARAVEGTGEFEEKYDKIRPVIAMYDNVMSAVVLEDSKIENINQAKGLKVGVPSKTTQSITAQLYEEAGVPADQVEWVFLSYNEQAEALRDGNIDIGTFTGFPKNGLLEELASTKGIRILDIDQGVQDSWNKKNPLWGTAVIPGGLYPGVDEDNHNYTYFTILYTNSDVPEEVIYDITKLILENNADVGAVHPAGKSITLDKTKEYIEKGVIDPATFHPGAQKYLKEKGVIK